MNNKFTNSDQTRPPRLGGRGVLIRKPPRVYVLPPDTVSPDIYTKPVCVGVYIHKTLLIAFS